MNAISKHIFNQSRELAEPPTADEVRALVRANWPSFNELVAEKLDLVCTNCGEEYGKHCGWEENPRCPNPLRYEPREPYFINGQFFSLVPKRCVALVADSEDRWGTFCGRICEAGKEVCQEHESQ